MKEGKLYDLIRRHRRVRPHAAQHICLRGKRSLVARIREEIVRTHEGAEAFLAGRAQEGEDALLASSPHESLYLFYLLARIDLMNGETARYNESAALFNAQYDAFSAAYNRAHRPRGAFVDRREWT